MTLKKILTARGVIVLALTATVSLSLISYRSIIKLTKLAGWVDHTHVVQLNLLSAYSTLSDADSELKAFLITKDSTYFTKLMQMEALIRWRMARLDSLTLDNQLQHQRISSLDSLIRVRWTYMESTMKGDDSHYEFYAAKIEECNQSLKSAIQAIRAQEEELLQARSNHSAQYQSTAPFLLLAVQLLIVLCLLAGFFLVTADLKIKERLQRETLENNKELQQQRDFIKGIFENTVDVIIIFDVNLNIIDMNKRARALYDQDHNSIGRNVLELYPQARGSHFIKGINDALAGKQTHNAARESVVHHGTFYESFFVPLYSGDKITGAMAIHHDVSEILKMASDLKETNEQLQKSNRELEQFAYVTSHDLQEPLRKIRTFADLAERSIEDKKALIKSLGKISASAERMSTLIHDILNYSRLSHVDVKQDVVDLNDVLDQVMQDLELTIEEKEAVIESNRLPRVLGSSRHLMQVFFNIISNALKFCTATPCIKINCRPVQNSYEITFSDNGIGFDQVYAEQIFGVFQRLHHRSEFDGTGIGLALCKRIVENHGGSIKATSIPNKGTTITVTLPDLLKDKHRPVTGAIPMARVVGRG